MQTTPAPFKPHPIHLRFAHLPVRERLLRAIGTRCDDAVRVVGFYGRRGELPHWFMRPISPVYWAERGAAAKAWVEAEVARSITMETTIELCGPDMEHGVAIFYPAHVARAAA